MRRAGLSMASGHGRHPRDEGSCFSSISSPIQPRPPRRQHPHLLRLRGVGERDRLSLPRRSRRP
ncbi:hypothetical protein F751_6550 [Auxenochlorella protothecoides]|uniref:Uncharacterized protein n=1 Tax=Auxenochlorella protothecoides TaxID=3075 RepID=A0A087STH7_AUXPR|nr:hypothetical protein F751_6550 [Auxenochlorella protothecoides]KFM29031.1 hypothetical protein F751_6550 [Auxenochlorella protothecoides]